MLEGVLALKWPFCQKTICQALGVSYIPRPNRVRFKSICSFVIANFETIRFYLPPSRKEDRSIILILFTMLMHSYFYVLITTFFYPFNYVIKETIFTERKSVAYYLKHRKAGRSSY